MPEATRRTLRPRIANRWLLYHSTVIAKVLLLAVSLLSALGLAELVSRSLDSRPVVEGAGYFAQVAQVLQTTASGVRWIPDSRVVFQNHVTSNRRIPLRINASGFRGSDIPDERIPDETRILVLGDSITAGTYLLEEEVYVSRIEHYLRESGRSVRVINAGIADIGLKEEVDILEESGLSTEPDVVVVGFYLNDSRPPWGFAGELGHRGWLRRHSALAERAYGFLTLRKWLEKHGDHRFRWVQGLRDPRWAEDRRWFDELVRQAEFDWGAAWRDDSWPGIEREFVRLKRLSEQHRFSVTIVIFPVIFQVEASFLDDRPQKRLFALASSFGFSTLDLLPIARKAWQVAGQPLFYDHCHPRPWANDLFGRRIAGFLAANRAAWKETKPR